MVLNADVCYQAVLSHDPRFDGTFFVAVSSTGIYCRPVCTVRTPRRENCAFYPSAAAAEKAGYRPCLRCRPELAPGTALVDAASQLAAAVAGRIEDGALSELSLAELAAEYGVTARHLRRVVQAEFGVSPVELAQTCRLLTAKRLLTDTDMVVIDVAYASGFASLRRFNALFKQRYRLSPSALRRERSLPPSELLTCELAYRPPFDWPALLAYLRARAAAGVEWVDQGRYLRTVALNGQYGWLAVEPHKSKNALRVQLTSNLAPHLLAVLARLKRLFDLAANPAVINAHLGGLAADAPGLRVPGAFDGFELAARAVLGQQTTVRAASTLAGRLAAAFGEPLETPFEQLNRLFPTPQRLAQTAAGDIAALGMPGRRAAALIALAGAVADGEIRLQPGRDVEVVMARLVALPGIGEWTAQYIAMRALGWPDAFPHTDLGIRKALGGIPAAEILERSRVWQPWRAYAAMHLWHSLAGPADLRDERNLTG